MFEVPGRDLNLFIHPNKPVASIDEDYQMIDAHVDDALKKRVINFDYIDLAKLLNKNRGMDSESHNQRLEIVSKNGMTYLSPVADKDNGQTISSYSKWEQAFRVYSNILTTKYPNKATELLQYNHTIQSASTAYIWDNVYAYDREFRHHISRHPSRPWNVILPASVDHDSQRQVKKWELIFPKGGTTKQG